VKSTLLDHILTQEELNTLTIKEIEYKLGLGSRYEQEVEQHQSGDLSTQTVLEQPKKQPSVIESVQTVLAVNVNSKKPKHTVGKYKLFPLVGVCVVAILAAGFFGVLTSYDKPIRATLYGQDISQNTWQQIEERITAQIDQLSVPVQIDDQSIVFTPSEIGIVSDAPKWAEDIKQSEAQRRKRPWKLFSTIDYAPAPTLDRARLSRTLDEKKLQTIPPIDAQITIDGVDILVTPAIDGWGADSEILAEKVKADIVDLKTSPVDLPRTAIKATYTTAQAEKTKQELEQKIVVAPSITGLYAPDRQTILSWYSVQPDLSGSFLITQNRDSLVQTVDQAIAGVDTVKEDRVEFRMPDGGKFVSVDGRVGKKVTNRDAIIAALVSGQSLAPLVQETPFAVVDGGEFNQWILIDLDAKQLYAYVGQAVVNQFAISGGKPSTPTPLGTFKIFAKTPVQTMCANYYPEGYSCTPDIKWISWFYPDYATHGAYWHNNFGVANVSHGCVNLRNDDSKWVYDWAPIGTPVIVRQTR
jgi:lipoprotein-anchoring transpeptidase ErfK/SrfK